MTYTCIHCRFQVESDDAVCPIEDGWCVCKRCYEGMQEREPAHPSRRIVTEVENVLRDINAPLE